MKPLSRDSSKYRPPGLLDYLWVASGLYLFAQGTVSIWIDYENPYGIATGGLVCGLTTTAVLMRHWIRRAPLRRWGAVINHSERPLAYHVCCAMLVSFGLMVCAGSVITLLR